MVVDCGATLPTSAGSSMSLPLSAVAAKEIEFSSRFCNNIRYSPAFTSSCRPICFIVFSCSGVCCIMLLYLPYCEATAFLWMSMLRLACAIARRILLDRSSSCDVRGVTVGLFSDALLSKRLRSSTISLYLLINDTADWSLIPMLAGNVSYL